MQHQDRGPFRRIAADPKDHVIDALFQVALALTLALIFSPAIRTVTSGLSNSVGRAWPFSMTYCRATASPGCEALGRDLIKADWSRVQARR